MIYELNSILRLLFSTLNCTNKDVIVHCTETLQFIRQLPPYDGSLRDGLVHKLKDHSTFKCISGGIILLMNDE